MAHGKVDVRECATGQIFTVWPVDARALLGSGEYEAADEVAARIAGGQPAYPLGKASPTREMVTPSPSSAAVPPAPTVSTAAEEPSAPRRRASPKTT